MVLFSFSNFLKSMFKASNLDISAEEFKEKLIQDRGVIIDVRTKEEYEAGHLKLTDDQKDFLNGDFQDCVNYLDKSKTYYLYCRSGNRSGKAAEILEKEGFKKVYNIGGFEDLVSAGFESKK
jgi:phage shock protein E